MEKEESRLVKSRKEEKKRNAQNMEQKRRQRIKILRKSLKKGWEGESERYYRLKKCLRGYKK